MPCTFISCSKEVLLRLQEVKSSAQGHTAGKPKQLHRLLSKALLIILDPHLHTRDQAFALLEGPPVRLPLLFLCTRNSELAAQLAGLAQLAALG